MGQGNQWSGKPSWKREISNWSREGAQYPIDSILLTKLFTIFISPVFLLMSFFYFRIHIGTPHCILLP